MIFGWKDGVLALLALTVLAGLVIASSGTRMIAGEARVVDGDTLWRGGRRLRLLGIDAPELRQSCERDGEPYPCGSLARAGLAAAIGRNPLLCRTEGQDRYGRDLAVCEAGGRDLGATMVREGLAVASGRYGLEELEARLARRGLWAGTFTRPAEWRRAQAGRDADAR